MARMHGRLAATGLAGLALLAGCESLPGSSKEQGAVAGGVGGAVAGHAIGDSALATILGGALGAGAGWVIGGEVGKLDDDDDLADAKEAADKAQRDPATAADVRRSDDADLNDDGFVTMDELIAMSEAGLNDQEMLARLEKTDQVFDLTQEQEDRLVAAGVDRDVVRRIEEVNRDRWSDVRRDDREVIGRSTGG